jgi:hypothetical protein
VKNPTTGVDLISHAIMNKGKYWSCVDTGTDGVEGVDGVDGVDGVNGVDGVDGVDGGRFHML